MFALTRKGSLLKIQTDVASMEWDVARGGQIAACSLHDALAAHETLARDAVWPDMVFSLEDGRRVRLADHPAQAEVVREEPDEIVFACRADLAGTLRITQQYEVFPEGAVFCEFSVEALGAPVRLREAGLSFSLLINGARMRWGYASRKPAAMRDATRIHAFFSSRLFLPHSERVSEPELLPWVSLDLGRPPARLFSNRIEFLMEDGVPLGGGDLDQPHTTVEGDGRGWSLRWSICPRGGAVLRKGAPYTNRWGIVFGAARTQAGAKATPARRNNLLGARIAHLGIPYLRNRREWPWRMLQTAQDPRYPAAYYEGMPPLGLADDAASGGADTVMVHQGWMSVGGSNNEPPADYRPADPDWLRAFVQRCHDLGLRVGLYMRGTEQYAMYSPFFEEFLQKDRDGLYVDWSSPLAMGWAKASPVHFSAYSYFHFTRALRARVGEGGFLQAHVGPLNTLLATLVFDSLVSGEAALQRDSLLLDAERCAYFGLLGGCGPCLITGNPHERRLFSSAQACAYSAALGLTTKAGLVRETPFDSTSAHLQPLWHALRALGQAPIRLESEAAGTRAVAGRGDPNVYASLFGTAGGEWLLLVANLGGSHCAATRVELDADALHLPRSARLTPVGPEDAAGCRLSGRAVELEGAPPFSILRLVMR